MHRVVRKTDGDLARRLLHYTAGLLVLAFGVALSALSGLGISPINSLPYVLSLILHWRLGGCVLLVYAVFVLLQVALLKEGFHLAQLGQLLVSALFGGFVDLAKMTVGEGAPGSYCVRLALLAASIVMTAIGVTLYVGAGLINMPADGFVDAVVAARGSGSFGQVKQILDCTTVLLSAALSWVCLKSIVGIREGTVLSALLIGRTMRLLQKYLPSVFVINKNSR